MAEYSHMNEIVPGLWVGDLMSTKDLEALRDNNIHSILTAMRGRIAINETFLRQQILLDDTEDADVLQHLIPAITFINAELEKGRGVLVHCQAGMSRSATIAAAYLMYTRNIDVASAIEILQKARPQVQPNPGFVNQLEIFHQANFRVSKRDKATRMFYLERAVEEVLNGDGSVETDMFAKFPRTPGGSVPNTPGGVGPRRRIRCKMCRTELASREHMMDHGQIGPPTPAYALSPAASRRPSSHLPARPRTSSAGRRPSIEGGVFAGLAASLSMSNLETEEEGADKVDKTDKPRRSSSTRQRRPSNPSMSALSALSMSSMTASAVESDDDEEDVELPPVKARSLSRRSSLGRPRRPSETGAGLRRPSMPGVTALSSLTMTTKTPTNGEVPTDEKASLKDKPASEESDPAAVAPVPSVATPGGLQSPADLAAQLYANPKLAALRGAGGMGMTPLQTSGGSRPDPRSPPILANPKCSGYFVEPMEWMQFFLQDGQLAGKITCPNKKCGAKLGNYDWAGVCCSCKEWVVPGFCIHRSKVDEIVV
ncbi:hypothetical protein PENSPDRAFT_659853 [Peniophora sp. CONT]|nr:hypothetical protein PENSPDRAFT_659853 [Peniophora sp. CONT]